ncbi:hypothetical protein E2I00_017664, partial [Balaenoptera physalus]
MLHTRLRPHCKGFLEKIAKLYELHVFTFGSRLYAHTIAGFLDPEKKLFSHRILSRDECIDPFSKTGNLREDGPAAFPDRQGLLPTTLFHPTPVHPKAPPGPEVRIYDASTGKLIRKGAAGPGPPGSLPVHAELSSF